MVALAQVRHGKGDAARFGEFDSVADEVVEHLPQVIGVAAQRMRNFRHDVGVKVEPADLRLMREDPGRAVDEAVQVEINFLDVDFAGFDFGYVEHILDQLEHGSRGFVHRLQHLGLFRAQYGVAQQVVHADDGIERRAHLVTHRGEEPALRLVRGLFAVKRIEQLRHQLSAIQREHDHPHQQADTENTVLHPIIVRRDDEGEAGDAERERVVQVRLSVAETVSKNRPKVNDV